MWLQTVVGQARDDRRPAAVAYATAARAAEEEAAPEDERPEAAARRPNAPIAAADASGNAARRRRATPPPLLPAAGRRPGAAAARIADAPLRRRLLRDGRRPHRAAVHRGQGGNFRAALGGAWRWRRFTFDAQLPFNLHENRRADGAEHAARRWRTSTRPRCRWATSTLGAIWTERLAGEALIAGLGVRGRLATHTTRFDFHLADGSLADFVIPYYFHIEPTLILGGALGRFTYVMNQGAIALVGPDGNFDEQHISVPSIYFWDAHYAIGWAPWTFLGASVELATMIQLNHIASSRPGLHQVQRHPRGVGRAGVAVPCGHLPHRRDRALRADARAGALRRARVRRHALVHAARDEAFRLIFFDGPATAIV